MEELKSHLKDQGANYVVIDEDLKSSEMKEIMKVDQSYIVHTFSFFT